MRAVPCGTRVTPGVGTSVGEGVGALTGNKAANDALYVLPFMVVQKNSSTFFAVCQKNIVGNNCAFCKTKNVPAFPKFEYFV